MILINYITVNTYTTAIIIIVLFYLMVQYQIAGNSHDLQNHKIKLILACLDITLHFCVIIHHAVFLLLFATSSAGDSDDHGSNCYSG